MSTASTAVVVKSVGIAAPGLGGWAAAVPVLTGAAPHVVSAGAPYAPALLPPNERRRATASVKLAFRAAEDAVTSAGADAKLLASVFSSSDADMAVLHRIRASLAKTPRMISPTDFHNSVHNAASGYWSIGVGSMAPPTTVCAYDASFTAGLVEAYALARDRAADVLLVVYDAVAPQPLAAKRPLSMDAGVAMIIGPVGASAGAASSNSATDSGNTTSSATGRISLDFDGATETPCANAALEPLRTGNPALRALPLFELIAARRAGVVTLRGPGSLLVSVRHS